MRNLCLSVCLSVPLSTCPSLFDPSCPLFVIKHACTCIKMYHKVPRKPPLPKIENRWFSNGGQHQESPTSFTSRHYSNYSPFLDDAGSSSSQMMSISHPSPASSAATVLSSPRVSRKGSQKFSSGNKKQQHVIERRNSEILLPDWRLQTVVRIINSLISSLISF